MIGSTGNQDQIWRWIFPRLSVQHLCQELTWFPVFKSPRMTCWMGGCLSRQFLLESMRGNNKAICLVIRQPLSGNIQPEDAESFILSFTSSTIHVLLISLCHFCCHQAMLWKNIFLHSTIFTGKQQGEMRSAPKASSPVSWQVALGRRLSASSD